MTPLESLFSTGVTIGIMDWQALDYTLLAVLVPLLVASAFFSASETALFGMSQAQRRELRNEGSVAGRAVEALLADQRMLLITVLLGNMTVNTLFFVISSVLMMRSGAGAFGQMLQALGFLLAMVLFGEVLPKMLATSARSTVARLNSPPLLAIHRLMLPIRAATNALVVAPLARLTTPATPPHPLTEEELSALLEVSGIQGVIDEDERRTLLDVFSIGRRRVRDVMVPRTRIAAVSMETTREDIVAAVRVKPRTRLPVFRDDLDNIVGMLNVKRYLADESASPSIHYHMSPPRYVPLIATLEQLLHHFQQTHTQTAIVVDEHGGTAGIVSIEDVVEELVGDITGEEDAPAGVPQLIGLNRWLVNGEMPLHDWEESFLAGEAVELPQVATLGGLIIHELGRGAAVRDVVRVHDLTLMVRRMDGARVAKVEIVRDTAMVQPDVGTERGP